MECFFSLLITALAVGLLNGMNLLEVLDSVLSGIGGTLGKIILILTFGAMLGKLIEESGAAHTITYRLIDLMGLKNVQYAILITGFLVGLPMMYNASFLVMIPLIYTFATTTRLPLLYLGIPLSASLSIAHAYLPPHPAPTYVSLIYDANINQVLLIGLIPVIPACLLAGILLSKFFKNLDVKPPAELHKEHHFKREELPGLGRSILAALTPVLLMLLGAVVDMLLGPAPPKADLLAKSIPNLTIYYQNLLSEGWQHTTAVTFSHIITVIKFLSEANIALFMAVLAGIVTLGLRNGKKMDDVMKTLGNAVGSIAMIILIIAAGGAFSQVLKDSQVNQYISEMAVNFHFNPLVLSFCVAALIRLAVGSATVATMTAAPIMVPIAVQAGISPELMVLATGSGSLMFSHFNDIGFWMFKEYYNVSIKQTFLIWTVMESIVGLVGLAACLILNFWI
ncbi:MAG: TRAP transporter large permease subunit [Bacteroidales bacterium]|nr:TRAP transporter large permease subunit [Bacteroidales bacterium]